MCKPFAVLIPKHCCKGHQYPEKFFLLDKNKWDKNDTLRPEGPNQGYIYLSEGVHLRLAVEGNNMFLQYLFPNIYTYLRQWMLFSKIIIRLLLNISMISHDIIFFMRYFRGSCSFVETLKGYMVRGRLGTPGLDRMAMCKRFSTTVCSGL